MCFSDHLNSDRILELTMGHQLPCVFLGDVWRCQWDQQLSLSHSSPLSESFSSLSPPPRWEKIIHLKEDIVLTVNNYWRTYQSRNRRSRSVVSDHRHYRLDRYRSCKCSSDKNFNENERLSQVLGCIIGLKHKCILFILTHCILTHCTLHWLQKI